MSPLLRLTGVLEVAIETVRSEIDIFVSSTGIFNIMSAIALLQQRNTSAWYPLKILAALVRQRNTCELCQRWTGHLLRGCDGHLSSTSYCGRGRLRFTQHPVRLPKALEEMCCGTSPARPQQGVHDGRRCGHILASSVLQYRHFRVPAFDRRGTFVESLVAALKKFNTVPRLIE